MEVRRLKQRRKEAIKQLFCEKQSSMPFITNQSVLFLCIQPSMFLLCWHLILAVVLVLHVVISGYQTTSWNTTCPKPCTCYMQTSEISHHILLKAANCSYQNLKAMPANFNKETEGLLIVGNYFRDISDYVPKLLELKELDISKNHIRSLGRGYTFLKFSHLAYLNIAKNELTSVVRNAFFGLINLKMLILSDNKLSFIEDQAFHGLTSLLILDLGHNHLASLYPEWFYGLVRLNELYIYENRVNSISSATFRALSSLQHLSLHGNRISQISNDGFYGLDLVNTLHLERNYLRSIPIKALHYLSSLKYLYMSSNLFERIQEGDVTDLPIEELVINTLPSLTLVDVFGFKNLLQLQSLAMKDCAKLAYIDAKAFANLPSLRILKIQNNHLLTLPSEISKALPMGVEIQLQGNPLLCDCNIRWILREMELSQKNASRIKFPRPKDIICDAPEHMQGTSVSHIDAASTLPVTCLPSILPLMENVIERFVGEPLILDCRSMGNPTPQLHWILPGGVVLDGTNVSNEVRYRAKHSGTIEFYHVKKEDQGFYVCVAENIMGRAILNMSVNIKYIDIHLYPIVVSSTFITFIWNGTARKDFSKVRIIYRVLPSTFVSNNNSNSSSSFQEVTARASRFDYTISNLIPESMYEVCIAYEDTGVYYIMLSCTSVRTRSADYMLQGINRTNGMDILIFLAIIIFIIIIVCFSIVTIHKCRQRQYVCPGEHVAYNVSHIPLKNLYSPLMSSVAP